MDMPKRRALHKWMLAKHGSVRGFARAAGIERSQAYRLINGEGCLLETAARVASALGISIDELAQHLRIKTSTVGRQRSA